MVQLLRLLLPVSWPIGLGGKGREGGALADYTKGRRKQLHWNFKFSGYFDPGALPLFRKVPSRSSVKAC